MDPDCINLRERFGKRYRITFDECYSPYHVPKASMDPWMMIVLCRIGEISPYGGDTLQLFVAGHRGIRKRLKAMDCLTLYTEGDQEACWLFDVKDFDQVAEVVQPRKRRVMSDKRKAEMSARLLRHPINPLRRSTFSDPKTHASEAT